MSRVSVPAARRHLGEAAASFTDEQIVEMVNAGYALSAFVYDNLQELSTYLSVPDDHLHDTPVSANLSDDNTLEDRVATLVDAGLMSRWDALRLVQEDMARSR
jgi:hypothetical protein